jgi:tetratricopeptide (TPR) repeat protein
MPPAPAPEHRAEVAQLVMEIDRARVEARTLSVKALPDRMEKTFARLDAVAARLDALDAAPAAEAAMVHAWYAVSLVMHDSTPAAPARESIGKAIELARKRRDDRMLALDYELQARLEFPTTFSIPRIEDALARATEAYDRAGHPVFLNGQLGERVLLAAAKNDFEGGIALIRERQRTPGSEFDHWRSVSEAASLAVLLSHVGRHDEAIAAAKHNLAVVSDAWGADHGMVAYAHEIVMRALYDAGDLHGALDEAHVVIAMRDRIHAAPGRSYRVRVYQVMITYELGLTDELESAATAFATTLPNDGTDAWLKLAAFADGEARYQLGEWALARSKASAHDIDDERALAAYLRGDYVGIEAPARRIVAKVKPSAELPTTWEELEAQDPGAAGLLAIADAHAGRIAAADAYLAHHARLEKIPDHGLAASVLLTDGQVSIALGRWDRARVFLERAKAFAVDGWGHDWGIRLFLDAALGRALLETGDAQRAIPLLEAARFTNNVVLDVGNVEHIAALAPDVDFALARALWDTNGDQRRARALVQRAIDHYGKFRARESQVATRWLADHPAP